MTIVIPTRNRANTLYYALQTCVMQDYGDLEILVSDNCSEDDTESVVRSLGDSRIQYVKTPRRLSMSANFDYALSFVRSGVVGYMGDDDALMPNAVNRAAAFMIERKVKALTSTLALYRWPSAPDSIKNTGRLQYHSSGDTCRNSVEYMNLALKGKGGFYVHGLASIYYGFADVSLLEPKGDRFFHSINPDAYAAFAIAAQIESYGYLAEPLFIIGASGSSNGVSHFQSDGDRKESLSFARENDLPFHTNYMLCRSLSVCVHEAFAQVSLQYPELVNEVRSHPRDLIQSMALEANSDTATELFAAALYIGARFGVDPDWIHGRFDLEKGSGIAKIQYLSDFASRLIFKAKNMASVSNKSIMLDYQDMKTVGVENCYQAAIFFDKVIAGKKL